MKNVCIFLVTLTMLASAAVQADRLGEEREAKQAELDAACEAVRQPKLVLARAKHVDECVETKMLADRESCERFYADYGESAASQAPLFYDLPECEKAHEYRRRYRSSGNWLFLPEDREKYVCYWRPKEYISGERRYLRLSSNQRDLQDSDGIRSPC